MNNFRSEDSRFTTAEVGIEAPTTKIGYKNYIDLPPILISFIICGLEYQELRLSIGI